MKYYKDNMFSYSNGFMDKLTRILVNLDNKKRMIDVNFYARTKTEYNVEKDSYC